jgi:hypothetical protein
LTGSPTSAPGDVTNQVKSGHTPAKRSAYAELRRDFQAANWNALELTFSSSHVKSAAYAGVRRRRISKEAIKSLHSHTDDVKVKIDNSVRFLDCNLWPGEKVVIEGVR